MKAVICERVFTLNVYAHLDECHMNTTACSEFKAVSPHQASSSSLHNVVLFAICSLALRWKIISQIAGQESLLFPGISNCQTMGTAKRNIDMGFNFLLQINRRKRPPKQNRKNSATADAVCQYFA